MSTRAQVHIISANQRIDFKYGISSDAYPDGVIPTLKEFNGDINLLNDLYFSSSPAGNANYYYEINCNTQTLKWWHSQTYWVNAPADWKEKGWNCWLGKNGNYGYSNWRKGKLIDTFQYPTPFEIQISPNTRYTSKALRALSCIESTSGISTILHKTTDPDLFHTYMTATRAHMEYYDAIYKLPYEEVPLHLNDEHRVNIYKWRLYVCQ